MDDIPELKQHKELIRVMQSLPEISAINLWTPKQTQYLKNVKNTWKFKGAKVDYLQMKQLGYRPKDPTEQLQDPFAKKNIDTYANYLFALLQLIIAGFDDIEKLVKKKGIEFTFQNPRELFAEICREFSSLAVAEATSKEIDQGWTLSQLRSSQILVGKFYRDSLPSDESVIFCQALEENGGWAGFAIAAIYSGSSARYLKKQSTPIGYAWKEFREAQKELKNFLNKEKIRTFKWNCGDPVWSDTRQPVDLSVF